MSEKWANIKIIFVYPYPHPPNLTTQKEKETLSNEIWERYYYKLLQIPFSKDFFCDGRRQAEEKEINITAPQNKLLNFMTM